MSGGARSSDVLINSRLTVSGESKGTHLTATVDIEPVEGSLAITLLAWVFECALVFGTFSINAVLLALILPFRCDPMIVMWLEVRFRPKLTGSACHLGDFVVIPALRALADHGQLISERHPTTERLFFPRGSGIYRLLSIRSRSVAADNQAASGWSGFVGEERGSQDGAMIGKVSALTLLLDTLYCVPALNRPPLEASSVQLSVTSRSAGWRLNRRDALKRYRMLSRARPRTGMIIINSRW